MSASTYILHSSFEVCSVSSRFNYCFTFVKVGCTHSSSQALWLRGVAWIPLCFPIPKSEGW